MSGALVPIRIIIGVAVVCATCGISPSAHALDVSDLEAIQNAVREICVQPDHKGDYLKIEGDLNQGATLSVAGVKNSGKITKESWEGISQRADKYKTDPRECAASITPILLSALTSPKDCSGRKIERYGREFDVARESPEMGGGHNPTEWCNTLIGTLRGEQPPGAEFTVVSNGERTRNMCPPFNCPLYIYHCTVHVKADPVCP